MLKGAIKKATTYGATTSKPTPTTARWTRLIALRFASSVPHIIWMPAHTRDATAIRTPTKTIRFTTLCVIRTNGCNPLSLLHPSTSCTAKDGQARSSSCTIGMVTAVADRASYCFIPVSPVDAEVFSGTNIYGVREINVILKIYGYVYSKSKRTVASMTETDRKITYHIENISGTESPKYKISTPDRINKIGFSRGNQIDIDLFEETSHVYLRIKPTDNSNHRVHAANTIKLPAMWDDHFETGYTHVIIEVNPVDSPELRVYDIEDFFQYRLPELEREGYNPERGHPIMVPILTWLTKDSVTNGKTGNLLPDIGQGNKEFKLVPFNTRHRVFQNTVEADTGSRTAPLQDLFNDVLTQGKVPEIQARKLTIQWSPEKKYEFRSGGWTKDTGNKTDKKSVYSKTKIKEETVRLPNIGEYKITVKTENGKSQTWLTYAPDGCKKHGRFIEDGWYSMYYDNTDSETTVYIPCNGQTR